MEKAYLLKKSQLARKNSFFVWNYYVEQAASHDQFGVIDDLEEDSADALDQDIKNAFGNFKSINTEDIPSLSDSWSILQEIGLGEEVSEDMNQNLSSILSFESLPNLGEKIDLRNLSLVNIDFLMDEIEPGYLGKLLFNPETLGHLPFPSMPQISSSKGTKNKIIFAFHQSEMSSAGDERQKSTIEIIANTEGVDALSLDLDLCISEYKDFSLEKIGCEASKVISVSSNPLTNSFLIEFCAQNGICFQHWDQANLSPLRFISDFHLEENSYLKKTKRLGISFRQKISSLLFQEKKEEQVFDSICTDATKLDSYNDKTVSLIQNPKNQIPSLTDSTFSFVQQLVLGCTELYVSKASFDPQLSLSVKNLLFGELERITGSDLLFKLIASGNLSDGFIRSSIEKRMAESTGPENVNIVQNIVPKILNPLFCYSCLDVNFAKKSQPLLEDITQILSTDVKNNGISSSLQWLVTCYTIMDEPIKLSALIDEYFGEDLSEIRHLMIYNSFISTALKHDDCFTLFNELIDPAPAQETNVIFLKNEILRAITHYLRKDSKKAQEIFHYVFQNDPNIFKKKYDNDWVNIDLMMCRLFEFINDQDPVDFFKDRSDTHAYNEFFAELFDSIFDQLDQVNIPPFSLQ